MGVISGDERLGKQQASLIAHYSLLQLPSATKQDFGISLKDAPTSQVRRHLTLLTLTKLYRKCSGFLVVLNKVLFFFKFREVLVRDLVFFCIDVNALGWCSF